ncbi:tyrosine-type recombinase/integrase [Alkalinema pantanalense CENA528]|uniref:tyrosine-type recombinase/integrase n=1 Tax=Alkalinema pantanalense TaxID=1620705 RepID=UPI003D6DCADF
MFSSSDGLPAICLVPSNGSVLPLPADPTDLRWLRVEEYFQARSFAENTQKAYRRELKRFLGWVDRPWAEVTPRQLAQFKGYLQEQGLSANSVNRALTAVMSFFSWLRTSYPESHPTNPAAAVELLSVPLPPAQDLSEAQIAALDWALTQRGKQNRAIGLC